LPRELALFLASHTLPRPPAAREEQEDGGEEESEQEKKAPGE
jgi:hypothetical protein